jgi:hypothetical protein
MSNESSAKISTHDIEEFSKSTTCSKDLSSFVEPLQLLETSNEDEQNPSKRRKTEDSLNDLANDSNEFVKNDTFLEKTPSEKDNSPIVQFSSVHPTIDVISRTTLPLDTPHADLLEFKYPSEIINQPIYNALNSKKRKSTWDTFSYSIWAAYLKIFTCPESGGRAVNPKLSLSSDILINKSIEKQRLWKSLDIRNFMKENIDKFMSNEYRIVGLEDKETDSGIKLYAHLVNRDLINEKINEEINKDEIKESKWAVEKFLGFRFDQTAYEFRYQVKFFEDKKTYSYASRDLDNASMKEEYRAEGMNKRTMKKYKDIPRANVDHLENLPIAHICKTMDESRKRKNK